MTSMLVRLQAVVQRWLGWEWAVMVVQRGGDVRLPLHHLQRAGLGRTCHDHRLRRRPSHDLRALLRVQRS